MFPSNKWRLQRFFKRPTRRELSRDLHNTKEARDHLRDQVKQLVDERDTLRKQRDALARHRNELVQSILELSAERDTLARQLDDAEETIAKCRTLLVRERKYFREQLQTIVINLGPDPENES